VRDEQAEQLNQIRFEVTKHSLALGTYRWPTAWRLCWQGSKGPASVELKPLNRKTIGNWGLVGFSMGIASGDLTYDGQQIPLYGLAELLIMGL
jgi:hypothetical protein